MFLQTFRQFLENWIFDGKSTAASLTKLVKILYYLKCAKKIFFGKILCSTHQKKCFYKLLGSFWKIEFWRKIDSRGPYKKGENFVLSQNELRIFFRAKFFVPLIKRSDSTNFEAVFGNLNFWRKIDSRGSYKIWWKFCTISKCAMKIIFGKILCSTHQKKFFYKLLGSFWKIEFLTENRQPRTLQKWWKFCTISKCDKKTFFGKILYSTQQKKCFYKLLSSFCKIKFLMENRQLQTLQKW